MIDLIVSAAKSSVFRLREGEMMRMRSRTSSTSMNGSSENGSIGSDPVDWELRPGGMLVQKRDPGSDRASVIKVRVKYGSSLHEIHIISQATFGDFLSPLSL